MQEEARECSAEEINEGVAGEVFHDVSSAKATQGVDSGDLASREEHPDSFVTSHSAEGLSEDIHQHAEETEGEGYAQNHGIQRQEIFHQLRENLEQSEGYYAPHYNEEGEDHYSEQEAFDYQQQFEQEHYAEEAHYDVVESEQGKEGNNDNASIEAEQKRREEEEEEERSKKPIPPKSNLPINRWSV